MSTRIKDVGSAVARTDIGLRRETNEDMAAWFRLRTSAGDVTVLMVADGLGGRAAGERASESGVRIAAASLVSQLLPVAGDDAAPDVRAVIRSAVSNANTAVRGLSHADPACDGASSTIVAPIFLAKSSR